MFQYIHMYCVYSDSLCMSSLAPSFKLLLSILTYISIFSPFCSFCETGDGMDKEVQRLLSSLARTQPSGVYSYTRGSRGVCPFWRRVGRGHIQSNKISFWREDGAWVGMSS